MSKVDTCKLQKRPKRQSKAVAVVLILLLYTVVVKTVAKILILFLTTEKALNTDFVNGYKK